jgi:hypothetical protein
MSKNIAVITQDEFESKLIPNANLTMAIPYLATLLVLPVSKKEVTSNETKNIQVQGHNHSSTQVSPTYAKSMPTPREKARVQEQQKIKEED